ncbi:MAG: ABC transporter ATP-binding protein [Acidimicrobiales bacterium]|nr:ABC transporter ATP-binding protein [Acidimicrobiales bacterium]
MTKLTFEHVSKSFGPIDALVGLNLTIEHGEFFALVGSSGCGKSTAMRIAGGLERPDFGDILLDGATVTHLKPRDRGLGMVTQQNALVTHRTAEGNISLPLEARSIHHESISARVRAEAEQFGVDHLLTRKRHELSGGEVQAVQLARALVARPRVLLLDEPLARIDTELRLRLRNDLVRIQRDYSVTTLLITADQEDAMVLADRVAVLHDGRLQQVGAPMDLYRQPVNTVVAGFFGEPQMNLLDVQVSAAAALRQYVLGDIRLPAHHGPAERFVGGRAILGIRPENVRLGDVSAPRALACTVTRTENRGSISVARLESAGPDPASGESVSLSVSCRGVGPRTGDRVGAIIDAAQLHLFDPYTGAALLHPIA